MTNGYNIIQLGNNQYKIPGCDAGQVYGDKTILKIADEFGIIDSYLYLPQEKLYTKVNTSAERYKSYPTVFVTKKAGPRLDAARAQTGDAADPTDYIVAKAFINVFRLKAKDIVKG